MTLWIRELRRLARDVLPMAAVALAVFWTIRGQILGCYRVVSSSMEPTLHGDPHDGDLVLVDRTAYWRRPPGPQDRFRLLVVRPAGDGRDPIVKRAVAFEQEYVDLRDGDLFVARTAQDVRDPASRWRKDPIRNADMLVTHFAFPGGGERTPESYLHRSQTWRREGDTLVLRAGGADAAELAALLTPEAQRARRAHRRDDHYLPGHLSTRGPVDRSFVDAAGHVHGGGGGVADSGVELGLSLPRGWKAVQLVLEYRQDYYSLSWTADGTARLAFMGAPAGAPARFDPPARGRVHVAFGHLDGRFFFRVGDRVWFPDWSRPLERGPWLHPKFPGAAIENLVHVAVAGADARIETIRVFHDIHYEALTAPFAQAPPPFRVQPGEVFLLGDNPRDSRDSRQRGGGFPTSDVLGRAIAVLAPRNRMHWLEP